MNYIDESVVQLVDYDRFNNSLTKLRDKKDKTLSDEKNLFKVCFSCPTIDVEKLIDFLAA